MHELNDADAGLPRRISETPAAITVQVDRNRNNGTIYVDCGVTTVWRPRVTPKKAKDLSDDVHRITTSAVDIHRCLLKQQTLRGSDERSGNRLRAALKVLPSLSADNDIARPIPNGRGMRSIILNVGEAADAPQVIDPRHQTVGGAKIYSDD
jgi:hypothetical protein